MLYVIQNIHWFLLLLGSLVFFHELGHFLVAKACGVKVIRFSLGFGPKLIGFRRGETEYQISALPLGGYVKMLGELPGQDIPAEDRGRALNDKPLWQRAAVLAAGPAFNFVLAFLIYWVMFVGTHTFGDTKLGIVSPDEAAWQAGLRPGDRIVSVNGHSVEVWEDLRKVIGSKPGQTLTLSYMRDGKRTTTNISPRPKEEKNVFKEKETKGRIGVSLQYLKPVIAVVDPQSPAAAAGLKTDDVITKINGSEVAAWHEVRLALGKAKEDLPVNFDIKRGDEALTIAVTPVAETPKGLESGLFSSADTPWGYLGVVNKDTVVTEVQDDTPAQTAGLMPGDRMLSVTIKRLDGAEGTKAIGVWGIDLAAFSGMDARSLFTLTYQRGRDVKVTEFELEEREEKDELKNVRKTYVFGAMHDNGVVGTYTIKREHGILMAAWDAMQRVGQDTLLIGKAIGLLVRGRLPFDSMGGPIMLFVIAEKSANRGMENFFFVMAMISVNLGLLNLMPIPVLDGGHLMFYALEAIRRRPPSVRTREIAHLVGLALLLVFMVMVFKNDILRYVLG